MLWRLFFLFRRGKSHKWILDCGGRHCAFRECRPNFSLAEQHPFDVPLQRFPDRIQMKVGESGRAQRRRKIQCLADQRKAFPARRKPGAERPPEVIDPHVLDSRLCPDPPPGTLYIDEMSMLVPPRKDIGIIVCFAELT